MSETNFIARHVIGGILGGGVGDVLNQTGAYLTEGKEFEWGSLATSMALGAVTGYAGAKAQYAGMRKACFTGDTKLRVRDLLGERWKRFDELLIHDEVLSRDEYNVSGELGWKRVEEMFVRTGRIWHLHAWRQMFRTTGEHPLYVRGKGWVPAQELQSGDLLSSHDGQWIPVEEAYDTGEYETVYNCRIADWHTYFVGDDAWGFSVWAHNVYTDDVDTATGKVTKTAAEKQAEVEMALIKNKIDPALAKEIAALGAKPNVSGDLLHQLASSGNITAANVIDFTNTPSGEGSTVAVDAGQLQAKFKHAGAFGVPGKSNKVNLAAYEAAIQAHIADPEVTMIYGAYLNKPARTYVHPDTNLMVITKPNGEFQSAWKNSPRQQVYAMVLGNLGGHS